MINREVISKLETLKLQARNTVISSNLQTRGFIAGETILQETVASLAAGLSDSLGLSNLVPPGRVKSTVRNSLRNSIKKQKDNEKIKDEANRQFNLNLILDQVRQYLSTISIPTPSLDERGNSKSLIKKLDRLNKYSTTPRKGEELIKILDEIIHSDPIPNSRISEFILMHSNAAREDAQRLISQFEISIRNFLSTKLSNEFGSDAVRGLPERILNAALSKLRKEQGVNEPISVRSVLDYVEFSEYLKIITSSNNWDACFVDIFSNASWIDTKLKDIADIRNKSMHSRGLSKHDFEKLKVEIRDVMSKIS